MLNKLNKLKNKRLLLLLLPIEIIILSVIKEVSNPMYIRYFVLNMSFILFYNYPDLLLSLHKKPVYYDDLIIKTYLHDPLHEPEQLNDKYKMWYQNIFKWTVLITSPIICALLTDVWFIKANFATKDESANVKYLNPETVSAMAIIFSLSSLYIKISLLFGKVLIKILKFFRNKSIEKQIKLSQDKINIELIKFDNINPNMRQVQSCIEFNNPKSVRPEF
jgi:hypothetical protein